MSVRTELAMQYMMCMRDKNTDGAMALLSDDVSMTVPMQGTMTGKATVEQAIRRSPGGGGGANMTWSEPQEEGDEVKIVGTGGPFGPIRLVFGFSADDKINKIDIGLGS